MQDMETPFPTSLCLTRRAKKYLHKASKRGQINDEAAVEGYLSDLRKWSWVKNKRQSGAMYCSVPECYGKCIRGGGIAKDSVLSILFVTQNHTESTKIKSKVPGTSKRQRLAISDTEGEEPSDHDLHNAYANLLACNQGCFIRDNRNSRKETSMESKDNNGQITVEAVKKRKKDLDNNDQSSSDVTRETTDTKQASGSVIEDTGYSLLMANIQPTPLPSNYEEGFT